MHSPTKKTLHILIACILFIAIILVAKNLTTKSTGLAALETSSGEAGQILNQNSSDTSLDTQTTNDTTLGDENLTESFSKTLFAKYYSAGNGAEISTADSQSIIDEAVNSFKTAELDSANHYSLGDLKIVKSNEPNLRIFANSFITKEEACLANVQKVGQATQDPIQTGTLYKKCAEELIKIGIPQEINGTYLSLLNLYYLMGEKVYSLEAAKSDPLKALIIIKEIGAIDNEKINTYLTISNLIRNSGIIFTNEEPGKAWVGGAQ